MGFNPVKELTDVVKEIEGKVPTEIEKYLYQKVDFLKTNGITETMHVGNTSWTRKTASEWLLSQFIGIIEKAKTDTRMYVAFGTWLEHVYHFVINNKAGLPEE